MTLSDIAALTRKHASVPSLFRTMAENYPSRIVYAEALIEGDPDDTLARPQSATTYASASEKVWKLSHFLQTKGCKTGTAAAIISYTRPEWLIADLAILSTGGISVSIYHSVNMQETGFILNDSKAEFVFAENQEQVDKLLSLIKTGCPIPETELAAAHDAKINPTLIISFEEVRPHPLVITLKEIFESTELSTTPPKSINAITSDQLASLVYTSGTTGYPKGVRQSHGNHIANIAQAALTGLFALDGELFLFLPLAHSFARLIGYLGFLTPAVVKFPAVYNRQSSQLKAESVLQDMRFSGAQVMPTVPRIMEKMKAAIESRATENTITSKLLRVTVNNAIEVYQTRKEGRTLSIRQNIAYLACSPIRKKTKRMLFGKSFRHAVSGGAKLPIGVSEFFHALGATIYEGYGLTETCVATNVNLVGRNKIGSVGPALDGVEVCIARDGEILFRGPNVTKGYFNRPEATSHAWDADGWFHTGDLGRLDEDGFLFITGRKKDLIITAGGKNVAPTPIEDKLNESPLVAQALVYGEGRPYCIALLSLNKKQVEAALKKFGIAVEGSLLEEPHIHKLLQEHVDRVNQTLSRHEAIKKFKIVTNEFTAEKGEVTPTFKVKRNVVYSHYQEVIDNAYES